MPTEKQKNMTPQQRNYKQLQQKHEIKIVPKYLFLFFIFVVDIIFKYLESCNTHSKVWG